LESEEDVKPTPIFLVQINEKFERAEKTQYKDPMKKFHEKLDQRKRVELEVEKNRA